MRGESSWWWETAFQMPPLCNNCSRVKTLFASPLVEAGLYSHSCQGPFVVLVVESAHCF